jgi:flagellar motor switch/type III secretory pathway protein FliN
VIPLGPSAFQDFQPMDIMWRTRPRGRRARRTPCPMPTDQQEIDALLTQAGDLADRPTAVAEPPSPLPRPRNLPGDPKVRQLLRLRVPVIVRLAYRSMCVRAIRKLANGSIIEFDNSADKDLDLLINNHPIGQGICVKVGERFGLRLTRIDTPAQRIKSMGR